MVSEQPLDLDQNIHPAVLDTSPGSQINFPEIKNKLW